MKSVDVSIVGGGMIGLATACLLAREGFQVVVLDQGRPPQWRADAVPGRVSALNLATRNVLQHIGVWDRIAERRVTAYRRMEVWDSHSDARIRFDAAEEAVPELGFIVENDLVSTSMYERLKQNYQVTLKHDCRVTGLETGSPDDHSSGLARLQLDSGETIVSELVIAADGARSALRELAGIDLMSEDFRQDAIVSTLACNTPHGGTAFQVFTPGGPVALLPLAGERYSLVWSRDRDRADALMEMDADAFCAELEALFGDRTGKLVLEGERQRFPLRSRHAASYLARNLVLVGDAAHTVHPLAGLGANLGMQDAAALAETLDSARRGGKRLAGQSALRRYERWRRGENGIAINAMKAFKSLFGNTRTPVRRAREAGFRLADSVIPVKHGLVQYALGLRGDLPRACRPSLDP